MGDGARDVSSSPRRGDADKSFAHADASSSSSVEPVGDGADVADAPPEVSVSMHVHIRWMQRFLVVVIHDPSVNDAHLHSGYGPHILIHRRTNTLAMLALESTEGTYNTCTLWSTAQYLTTMWSRFERTCDVTQLPSTRTHLNATTPTYAACLLTSGANGSQTTQAAGTRVL